MSCPSIHAPDRLHRAGFGCAASLLAALLIAGCGGGGGGGSGPRDPIEPETLVITTAQGLGFDGRIDDQDVVDTSGALNVGDKQAGPGRSERVFLCFDVSDVPSGATIDEATLEVSQTEVLGEPYADLGDLVVTPVDVGTTLDSADRDATARGPAVVLSGTATLERKSADVTELVRAELAAGRDLIQLRCAFSLFDGSFDEDEDRATLQSAEQPPLDQAPTLRIVVSGDS